MKKYFIIPLLFIISACSSSSSDEEKKEILPPETLFQQGDDFLAEGEFKLAIEKFNEIERNHPYSDLSSKALVRAAESNYRIEDYAEVSSIVDRFLRLYPADEKAPYMLYLRAISSYEQIADVQRDQKNTLEARNELQLLIQRFPNSDEARKAKFKLDLVNDHLAGKEMEIGRYYLRQNRVQAAINRFRIVVQNFDTTSHTPEALHRLVESFLSIGVTEEAKRYAAVLGHNYPDNIWYQRSFELMKNIK